MNDGQPRRLCAGWCAATGAFEIMESVKLMEEALS
jgi:hypothetical protein